MSIIKSKHASNYTVVPNEIFKQDLSIKAIGLFCYLISLPHDWIVYKTKLHLRLNAGKHEIDTAFNELREKGYILSVEKRNEKTGRMEYEHIVYDKPFNGEMPATDLPCTAEPHTVEPCTVNQSLLSTNTQSTNYKVNRKKEREAHTTIPGVKASKTLKQTEQPPTLQDVMAFFKEKGYTQEIAKRAWEYYNVADWMDSKGNVVHNWRQKMISVWMKETDKIQKDNGMGGMIL